MVWCTVQLVHFCADSDEGWNVLVKIIQVGNFIDPLFSLYAVSILIRYLKNDIGAVRIVENYE